jgi:hypothetical protein
MVAIFVGFRGPDFFYLVAMDAQMIILGVGCRLISFSEMVYLFLLVSLTL